MVTVNKGLQRPARRRDAAGPVVLVRCFVRRLELLFNERQRQTGPCAGSNPWRQRSGHCRRIGNDVPCCLHQCRTECEESDVNAALAGDRRRRHFRASQWLLQLTARVGWQKVVVARANKNGRILWAVLAKGGASTPITSRSSRKVPPAQCRPWRHCANHRLNYDAKSRPLDRSATKVGCSAEDARHARLMMKMTAPQAWWPAVGAPVERWVRPHLHTRYKRH